jgi:hypothetical protein
MVATLHNKSQKRKIVTNNSKKTQRNIKKKSKRFMPPSNEYEYKTFKKILKPTEGKKEELESVDQEGGGFIRRFSNWRKLRRFQSVYKNIEKATIKLAPFVAKFKVRGDILGTLLKDRIDNVNYLMIRYQHLISYEKQEAYIKAMHDKLTNGPEDASLRDYYTSEMNKIKLEHKIVKDYINEYTKRKTSNDNTIDKYRKELETTKVILDKKFQRKFNEALNAYQEITPELEEVGIKLKEDLIAKTKEGKEGLDKKTIAEASDYYKVFAKFAENKEKYEKIHKAAKETNRSLLEYQALFEKNRANYDQVDKDYKKQITNYDEIKPVLMGIFGTYIPKVMGRKLPELTNQSQQGVQSQV